MYITYSCVYNNVNHVFPVEFNFPRDVAICRDTGRVMVADTFNSRIQILDNKFQHIKDITHDGDGRALSGPACICINNNGDIIISDYIANRVLVYDKTGLYKIHIPGPWCYPWGVTVDDDGLLYVCDIGTCSVKVIDKGCNIIQTINNYNTSPGSFTSPPYYIKVHGDHLLVSDSGGRVYYLTKSGEVIKTLALGIVKRARGMTVNQAGDLIIVDEEGPVTVVRDGRVMCRVGETAGESWHLSRPGGVAVTSTGQVVVANREQHNLLVYDMVKNIHAN